MGLSRQELESYKDASVPDLIGPGVKLLFVGINPGLWTAATQTHFAHPGNRFYPALYRAGLIDWEVDRSAGFDAADRERMISRGIGITNLVNRATVRASELDRDELQRGATRLEQLVSEMEPALVAVAGVTAYRTAFRRPKARLGKQPEDLAGAALWAVPNPSGLNAHETIESLAGWYRQVGEAAGIVDASQR